METNSGPVVKGSKDGRESVDEEDSGGGETNSRASRELKKVDVSDLSIQRTSDP